MLRAEQISRRLRQLNVLVAVVRWGSMARAAEHLAISKEHRHGIKAAAKKLK